MDRERFQLPDTPCTKSHGHVFDHALRVYEYYEDVVQHVTQSKKLSYPITPFESFFLMSLSQIQMSYISILHLCAIEHMNDCNILLRSVYEHLFHIGYMQTNPVTLGKQWEDYECVYRIRNAQRLMKSPDFTKYEEEVRSVLQELTGTCMPQLDFFTRNDKQLKRRIEDRSYFLNWTKKSIGDIARVAGMKEEYRTVYNFGSDYVHPTPRSLQRYVHLDPHGDVDGIGPRPTYERKEVGGLIGTLSLGLLKAVELVSSHFDLELTDRHSLLVRECGSILATPSQV